MASGLRKAFRGDLRLPRALRSRLPSRVGSCKARSVKEDVLEQVRDDYLKLKGYFTTHNVGFRPPLDHPDFVMSEDSVRSDTDVVGYHPRMTDIDRVIVVAKMSRRGHSSRERPRSLAGRPPAVAPPNHDAPTTSLTRHRTLTPT